MIPKIVVIRGAGDLATGVASRLWNSGFSVVMLELPRPLVVRRTVSFATAIYEGSIVVEGTRAEHCPDPGNIKKMLEKRVVPVLKDPDAEMIVFLKPHILIDAIMAKKQTSTNIMHADLVIGLGPGFRAGEDVHAVVETKRGHHLGRVYYRGSAAKDTSEPGIIEGYGKERLLRAPAEGIFKPYKKIGDIVKVGDIVAAVDRFAIRAQINGLIRGMLYDDIKVTAGMKVGDIDPRGETVNYHCISDKARAVGGGVLEAILNRYFKSS